MSNDHKLNASDLQALLDAKQFQKLRQFCEESNPAVIGEFLSQEFEDDPWAVLQHIPQPLRSQIFSHLDGDMQIDTVDSLPRHAVASLLTDMPPDDRVDLFKRLPEDRQENVLPALAQAEREDLRRLSSYAEGTAGSVMTSDYAVVLPQQTVLQAIEHLRRVAPDRETIYYAYVVDDQGRILGFVSLKDLIVSRSDKCIEAIMHREFMFARTDDDREDAARKIQKYDMLALPVVNETDALVGIITHDDAMDVITQEYTEDMEKFMAISGSHEDLAYIKTSPWRHFKNRAPWVMGLAVLGLVSGFIVQNFEGLLLQFAILAAFMPMLADTGGNTGSQSATLVVRALAMKEISPCDVWRVLAKEFVVGLMLAVLLGVIAFGRVYLVGGSSTTTGGPSIALIGFAIALALSLQVITATLVGAILPLSAARLKLDPAVVASPALTTIVDISGLMIYFLTVKWILL